MEPHTSPTYLQDANQAIARKTRQRLPLPPSDTRDWMTAQETALKLGCSLATVHRLRRGLFAGVGPLPCVQFGRKYVFMKYSVARWQETNERIGASA